MSQDIEDKRTTTGCCGLTFLKRSHNRRSKSQKDAAQDSKDGKDNKESKDNKDNVGTEPTKDPDSAQINHRNPINLAGITLNLNVTPASRMEKSQVSKQ